MDNRSTARAMHLAFWETFDHLVEADRETGLTPFHHAISNGNPRLLASLLAKLCSHLLPRSEERRRSMPVRTEVPAANSEFVCIRNVTTTPPKRTLPPPPSPIKIEDLTVEPAAPPAKRLLLNPPGVGRKRIRVRPPKKQCEGDKSCSKGANAGCLHGMCISHCKDAQNTTRRSCSVSAHRKGAERERERKKQRTIPRSPSSSSSSSESDSDSDESDSDDSDSNSSSPRSGYAEETTAACELPIVPLFTPS
jgi:hypothetical protein